MHNTLPMFKIGTSTKGEDLYQTILRLTKYDKLKVFLVTMDVEKTFDPLDHKVLFMNFGA